MWFNGQESPDPRCWTGSGWIVINDSLIPVTVALFGGGSSFNAAVIKFSLPAFQPGATVAVDEVEISKTLPLCLSWRLSFCPAKDGFRAGQRQQMSRAQGAYQSKVRSGLWCMATL